MEARLVVLLATLALVAPLAVALAPPQERHLVVAPGFAIAPLAAGPAVTAITFGPSDDLYATTLLGDVYRYPLEWTPAGPVLAGAPEVVASGFSQPLGLVFHGNTLIVADSVDGAESGRLDGRVSIVVDGEIVPIVSGLPNGRHNTNNLRFGPDARLYIANGNPNDNGIDGGEVDVFPYSGAILSVDADEVIASPAVLHWRSGGSPIPAPQIASHPLNADFAAKVDVLAFGFRNVYDIAFSPAGIGYTGMNGADVPSSQDALFKLTGGGQDFGYPFCFNEGPSAAVGDDISVVTNPTFPGHDCSATPPATALLGWHTCATGLDVPPAGSGFGNAVYVAECGPFFPEPTEKGFTTRDTGHKVTRVALDENGDATKVEDFVVGLHLPTDVHFGPDGAMYVADVDVVYRVASLLPSPSLAEPSVPVRALATPGAWLTGFATPVLAVQVGGDLSLTNGDIMRHDLVALEDTRPGDASWCPLFPEGACPLFWSAKISTGATTPVLGLGDLEAGRSYAFYCSLHPGSMQGTLVALPTQG